MECSICYEKFIYPKPIDDINKLFEEFKNEKDNKQKNNIIDFELEGHFLGLIITPTHNESIKCETNNCKSVICGHCWSKYISDNFKDIEKTNQPHNCPYCKQTLYKYYMTNVVLNELMSKLLGDKYNYYMYNKLFKDIL